MFGAVLVLPSSVTGVPTETFCIVPALETGRGIGVGEPPPPPHPVNTTAANIIAGMNENIARIPRYIFQFKKYSLKEYLKELKEIYIDLK